MSQDSGTDSVESEVKLSTTQIPSVIVDLIRKVRSARGCTIQQAYMRYVVPALEKEWEAVVREEAKRIKAGRA